MARDVGACVGDTTRRFLGRVGWSGRVVAFEPSPQNRARLAGLRDRRLEIVPVGASDAPATIPFTEAGGSSAFHEGGETSVRVERIDDVVDRLGLDRVDVIKLDVEGFEGPALDGASRTIRRHRPMLQVSIYHRTDDLFSLPLRLMDELDDYAFYLGHHSYYRMETDVYALPRERM